MEVANDIVKSQTATNFESQNYILIVSAIIIPLVSIIATAIASATVACYTIKKNQETTKMNIEANTKNLMIQINQVEMRDSIKKLFKKVKTGDIEKIQGFIDSGEGVYIPASLKKAIKEILKGEMDTDDMINAISDLIDNYISPLLDWKVL